MNVSQEDKLALTLELLPDIFARLAEKSPDRELDADDVIDLLAIWLASIIENDSHITTLRLQRIAIETIGAHIKGQIPQVAEYRSLYGQSLLSALIAGPEQPSAPSN